MATIVRVTTTIPHTSRWVPAFAGMTAKKQLGEGGGRGVFVDPESGDEKALKVA
jgi:hypothetical protein